MVFGLASVLALGGCAITPEPLTLAEQAQRADQDRLALFRDQEPISRPISLGEAVARAIKYNFDYRLTAMEQALQNRQLDVSRYDLLPRLTANGGLLTRNNDPASSSRSIESGRISLEPSTSQDRRRATADLTMSWNVLDFGVSYFQAQQQADRTLAAAERRRRTIHSIVQQVRGAYWQAVAAQHLSQDVQKVLAEARAALADSETAEAQQLLAPLDALRYQKAMLEIVRQLEGITDELAVAQTQLAALMNLPPGTPFAVEVPDLQNLAMPKVILPVVEMERVALINRPELREEGYQARIGANEVRKAIAKMLPGLTLSAGGNYDSNSYMVDNAWAEAGLRVTWNLFSLLTGPANIEFAEVQQEVGDTRRVALSMAVLAQVHVGYRQYQRALQQFEYTRRLDEIEQRIYGATANAQATDALNELERIRSAATAVSSALQRDRSYADLQNAVASIYVSLGLDPLPEQVESHDIAVLTEAVDRTLRSWEQGQFTFPDAPPPQAAEVPAVAVPEAAVPGAEPPVPEAVPVAAPVPEAVPVAKRDAWRDTFSANPLPGLAVQVASYRNRDDALRGWQTLLDNTPDLIRHPPYAIEVTAKVKTPVYRVLATGFTSDRDAEKLCATLHIPLKQCKIERNLGFVSLQSGKGKAGV